MSVVRFTKDQFSKVVTSTAYKHIGILPASVISKYSGGELQYRFPITDVTWMYINSSIDKSGIAADTGENSIRAWLADVNGMPVSNKTQRWVTRVKGWEQRTADMLEKLMDVGMKITTCPRCKSVKKVFEAKNGKPENIGRLFSKCGCPDSFQWLDETPKPQATQPTLPIDNHNTDVKCPKCGSPMKLRNGKNGQFYGCSTYPKCYGTLNLDEINRQPVVEEFKSTPLTKAAFKPSEYQQAVFDWAKNRQPGQHLVIEALAGSGKTTTGIKMLGYLPRSLKILFVAFNVAIKDDVATKLKLIRPDVHVKTFHGLGFGAIRKAYPNVKIDSDLKMNKTRYLLEQHWGDYLYQEYKPLVNEISKLVGLVKANLTGYEDVDLLQLCQYYDVTLNGHQNVIFDAVRYVIVKGLEICDYMVDFDDMPWIPVVKNLPVYKYGFIYLDEAQDTNKCQLALVMMHIADDGSIAACGDRYQSIYGYRGADASAIPTIIETLQADTLPLSVTYRVSKAVTAYVNEIMPEIPLICAETVKDGGKFNMSYNHCLDAVIAGDMVLCRTNAPLVKPVFQLIARGVKAIIRGRNIGDGLISLIERMKASDIDDLLQKVGEYQYQEVAKLLKADKKAQAEALTDRVACVMALCDGVYTIPDLIAKIKGVFTDNVEGVVFSSVHKAKGLEAPNIFILKPELMPHPNASQDWELEQERNLEYVAYTRTLDKLIFVND